MYTVAQPVKIKKIYHNGNHLEDKGNFCLSGSGDGTDVDISGYCEYIIEQHDDERGETILRLKYETPETEKIIGVEYYQAVIRDGVRDYSGFKEWRKQHPVTGVVEWMP